MFREIEAKVMLLQGQMRHEIQIKNRIDDDDDRQNRLFSEHELAKNFARPHGGKPDPEAIEKFLVELLQKNGPVPYETVIASVLEEFRLTRTELNALVGKLWKRDLIDLHPSKPRQRVPKEGNILSLKN